MYIVRFIRKDGKHNEEYYYRKYEDAFYHLKLFYHDDTEYYDRIDFCVIEGEKEIQILSLKR